MDSRDSTSQSTSFNRDTSSSGGLCDGDDDSSLLSATSLAKDAFSHFHSLRFSDCLDVLYQLKQKTQDDPKVEHNIAIARYFEGGCSDPKKLLEILNTVKKRSEELARASREKREVVSNTGNKAPLGCKGTVTTHTISASADELDPVVATLNIAIIWFHLHEYTKSLSVLMPLYLNIEPIDEPVALNVCLLLLDVALLCQDASKFADVMAYLEKAFGLSCMSQGDNGSGLEQQSGNLVGKSFSVPSNSSVTDASYLEAPTSNGLGSSLSGTLSLSSETLEYDTMFSMDMSEQNLSRSHTISSSSDFAKAPDKSMPMVDLKLKLQLYKVQFLLLTRNLKQAKREVKFVMNIARGIDSSVALLLKSQLEYARGNYRKAIKLLMASTNRTEMGIPSMLNNLGCIYYQLRKYHTSSVLFSKALRASSSLRKDKPQKLSTLSQDKSPVIMYNCGMQQLTCGNPLLAARCFQKASLVYYRRPILWLRLAECCLMALDKKLISDALPSEKSEITIHVIGSGKWRNLALGSEISENGKTDSFEGTDRQPKLSLSVARQCLLNGLQLLESSELNNLESGLPSDITLDENDLNEGGSLKSPNHTKLSGLESKLSNLSLGGSQVTANGDAKDTKTGIVQEMMQNCILNYEDVRRRENHMMKQALLANLAYIDLELENPAKALSTASSLLELPDCSRIYIFLGHVYAAEALCLLNKPKEAAEHLFSYLSGESNIGLPFSQDDLEQWRTEKTFDGEDPNGVSGATNNSSLEKPQGIVFIKPEEARGTLFANLATIYAAQGELDRAQQFVTQALALIPNHAEATLTAVYVDIMLGKSKEAVTKLKQCSKVRFLPGGVRLNKPN